MRISGTIGDEFKGKLRGKSYIFDFGLDFYYVRVREGDAAYSDYLPISDKGSHKNRYFILDFDKDRRVVGFTIEGLLEDALAEKSLQVRILYGLSLNLLGAKSLAVPITKKILEYIREQLPALDSRGRLIVSKPFSYA